MNTADFYTPEQFLNAVDISTRDLTGWWPFRRHERINCIINGHFCRIERLFPTPEPKNMPKCETHVQIVYKVVGIFDKSGITTALLCETLTNIIELFEAHGEKIVWKR